VATLHEVSIPATRADGRARVVPAAFATPDTGANGGVPAVLLLHEAFGLTDDLRRIARRFADNGYAALAPDFLADGAPRLLCMIRFFQGIGQVGTGQPYRDLAAARGWLKQRPDVDAERIGLAGFCVGGGFALLHAATRHDVNVVAPFYAHLPKDIGTLRNVCPVVASYGGRDGSLRGAGDRLERALRSFGVPSDVRTYPEAGHSFMNVRSGLSDRIGRLSPMHAGYVESASEDAWRRMLAFFGEHIGAAQRATPAAVGVAG
jgi:carboxymethylenebutenolidase